MKETDVILLTDFDNTTGDPSFDGTLKQALAVKFEESPFLNVFPEARVRETLEFMRRAPAEKLTAEIGREVCQRQNLKAMLNSQVAPLGSQFVITMVAVNCETGTVLARDQVQASSKESVLKAVGDTALHMRQKLGESLPTIQRMNAPIDQATTTSLEALKAFSAAESLRARGADAEAMPLLQRAIDLDPMFTLAYARLGVLQSNAGEVSEARKLISKAYELRDRVSERERLYVTAHYHRIVERDQEKAIATYKLWRQTYPRDYIPAVNLGNIYQQSGRLNEATQQLEESLKLNSSPIAFLNLAGAYAQLGKGDKVVETCKTWMDRFPEDGTPHFVKANYHAAIGEYDQELTEAQRAVELEPTAIHHVAVARAYVNLNRLSDAKAEAESAIAAKLEHPDLHYYLTIIAQLQGDQATVDREIAWSKDKPSEFFFTALQGSFAASRGHLHEAEAFYRRSVEVGSQNLPPDEAGRFKTTGALVQSVFGNSERGKALISEALKSPHTRNMLADAATVFAFAGDDSAMESALAELAAKFPNDAIVRKLSIPLIRSTSAIQRKQPDEVFNLLKDVAPFKSIEANFLSGAAHAESGRHQQAIAEFQVLLDNPGLAETTAPLTYQLAFLHMARSYAALGDAAKARSLYEKFFAFFKNPDPDIPLLQQARTEFAKLKNSQSSR
jgi:tetratricopeptide (TPR) repeat protein